MTELTTIDTNNYAEMAKAMGMANEASSQKKQGMFLARLRIQHSAILGTDTIKVKGGTYKLEIPDGPTYYAESAVVRPFMQRFMYKKFVKRVRVVLGIVELTNPKDAEGNPVDIAATPFIWEVENRDAFKTVGGVFTQLAKMKRLPV